MSHILIFTAKSQVTAKKISKSSKWRGPKTSVHGFQTLKGLVLQLPLLNSVFHEVFQYFTASIFTELSAVARSSIQKFDNDRDVIFMLKCNRT